MFHNIMHGKHYNYCHIMLISEHRAGCEGQPVGKQAEPHSAHRYGSEWDKQRDQHPDG